MFGQNREKKRFSWRWAVLLVALVAGSLLLAACGDSDPSPTATPEPTPVQATPDKDDDTMMDEDADAMMDEDADAMMDEDDDTMMDEDADATPDKDDDTMMDEDADAMMSLSDIDETTTGAEPAPATASSGTAVTPTDPTTSIDPGVTVSGGITLADDCTVGGTLDDAATVIACNTQAMQQYESFSFDLTFNLLAAFPMEGAPEGAGEGLMRLSGGVLLPDKLQYTVSLGPAGQTIDINGVTIGADTYFQDPESMQWVKGTPPDDALLSVTPMVGLLYLATDVPTTLGEMVTLDDGTKAYVLVTEPPAEQSGGMGGMDLLSAGNLTRVVGADDFLTREVRISVVGLGGEAGDVATIRYHGFGEPLSIEPPESYTELPPEAFSSGVQEPATVLGLARNGDGNVEVTFSKPVVVQGEIVLYVLEPSTGGWELPLLSGSGTDTLIFSAAPEGKPALMVGESQIAWIGFGSDAQLVDENGVRANDLFDTWTYQ